MGLLIIEGLLLTLLLKRFNRLIINSVIIFDINFINQVNTVLFYLWEWTYFIVNKLIFHLTTLIFLMLYLNQSPIPQEMNHILRWGGLLSSLHFLIYVVVNDLGWWWLLLAVYYIALSASFAIVVFNHMSFVLCEVDVIVGLIFAIIFVTNYILCLCHYSLIISFHHQLIILTHAHPTLLLLFQPPLGNKLHLTSQLSHQPHHFSQYLLRQLFRLHSMF